MGVGGWGASAAGMRRKQNRWELGELERVQRVGREADCVPQGRHGLAVLKRLFPE